MNKNTGIEERQVVEMLELLQPVNARNGEAAQRGKQQFLTQAKILRAQTVSKIDQPRHIVWNDLFRFRKEKLAMQILTSAVIILTLLFGGAGGTVYASQSSMPDEALYPVKIWSEDVRLDLIKDTDEELSLLGEFTNRRISEIQNSYEQGEVPSQAVLDRLQTQTRLCLETASNLSDEGIVAALTQIHDRLMQQDRIMEQLHQQDQANESMTQAMEQFRAQIRLVEEGLRSPAQYRHRMNNPNEDVPENTPVGTDPEATATEVPASETTDVPGNGYGNQNQNRNRYTLTPQATEVVVTDTVESSEASTLEEATPTVVSNGNQYGDGECDGSNCQGDGDCDGECDGTNCQGIGDCDGTQTGDQDGSNCQGTGDCDGTGNDGDTSETQSQNQYGAGNTEESTSATQSNTDNGNSNGNGNR